MNGSDKALSLLGLAARARKIVSGEELVVKGIQRGIVFYVIIAEDASINSKKKIIDKCNFYDIPFNEKFDRNMLGHAIGKESRITVGITDQGFSNRLEELLK